MDFSQNDAKTVTGAYFPILHFSPPPSRGPAFVRAWADRRCARYGPSGLLSMALESEMNTCHRNSRSRHRISGGLGRGGRDRAHSRHRQRTSVRRGCRVALSGTKHLVLSGVVQHDGAGLQQRLQVGDNFRPTARHRPDQPRGLALDGVYD